MRHNIPDEISNIKCLGNKQLAIDEYTDLLNDFKESKLKIAEKLEQNLSQEEREELEQKFQDKDFCEQELQAMINAIQVYVSSISDEQIAI